MANPQGAATFSYIMDPSDVVDFAVQLSRGSDPADALQAGEDVASYVLEASETALSAGLIVHSSAPRAPAYGDLTVGFWLSVEPSLQTAAMFDNGGVVVGVRLTVVTTASPPRTKQMTFLLNVRNK
jgi:hypothetical protein